MLSRALAALLLISSLLLVTPPSAAEADVTYTRPLPGRVLRGFEPGSSPYSAGHRGVDLALAPGDPVRAAAAGRVSFAGVVVGVRWVTVEHRDGVRTSYGPLASDTVERGGSVRRGQVIGSAADEHDGRPALHWSARRDDRYLDPMQLLRPPIWRPALVGPGQWHVTDLPSVPSYGEWDGEHRWNLFVPGSPEADGPGWALPPNPNHVIVIAGFGSASGRFPIDPADLGYPPSSVTELSHAGRDPGRWPDPDDPRRDQLPYTGPDTLIGIEALARQLRAQLQAHAAAHPGQAVDLVGHSMGGVVAFHYLLTMHHPTDPTLPPIGNVATFASPLEGADLANLADGVASGLIGEAVLRLVGAHDEATAHSTVDLAVGSDLLRELADAWAAANHDPYAGPLATGTRVLTVGASRDVVVPEHRSDLPGTEHVVLPGGHSSALDTEAARIVLRDFLAGQPPPGEDGGIGHWVSYPVGVVERGLGYAAPWAEQVLGARLIKSVKEPLLTVGKALRRRLPWPRP